QLLNQVYRLHKGVEKHHNITITVSADPKTLELIAEPNIIKQVLINLLKMHLVPWKANIQDVIVLNGELSSRGRITIRVRVRVLGIPPEHIEKVFKIGRASWRE